MFIEKKITHSIEERLSDDDIQERKWKLYRELQFEMFVIKHILCTLEVKNEKARTDIWRIPTTSAS